MITMAQVGELFAHNAWANRKLFTALEALSAEDYRAGSAAPLPVRDSSRLIGSVQSRHGQRNQQGAQHAGRAVRVLVPLARQVGVAGAAAGA